MSLGHRLQHFMCEFGHLRIGMVLGSARYMVFEIVVLGANWYSWMHLDLGLGILTDFNCNLRFIQKSLQICARIALVSNLKIFMRPTPIFDLLRFDSRSRE